MLVRWGEHDGSDQQRPWERRTPSMQRVPAAVHPHVVRHALSDLRRSHLQARIQPPRIILTQPPAKSVLGLSGVGGAASKTPPVARVEQSLQQQQQQQRTPGSLTALQRVTAPSLLTGRQSSRSINTRIIASLPLIGEIKPKKPILAQPLTFSRPAPTTPPVPIDDTDRDLEAGPQTPVIDSNDLQPPHTSSSSFMFARVAHSPASFTRGVLLQSWIVATPCTRTFQSQKAETKKVQGRLEKRIFRPSARTRACANTGIRACPPHSVCHRRTKRF
ncbi:hypothetical protein BKA62DRAFT_349652 [Auriculariales sp. MPI-PUGE-AT-0066]|nr:hypothetical protein BKA62DRAFT_349652 [Auriculariales sp. MPI-PUGE-AT-0066]